MFPKKQTLIKSYQFKITTNQEYLIYYQRLVEQAATKLLADLWSENWIERLGTSKQKAFTVINEVQVEMKQDGKKIYLPSRVRRGIAERVGRIIRGQYKRKHCYDDCLKVIEQVGQKVPERKLVRIVLQTYRTNKNYPFYKKVMIQQTIQMIKKWYKKLALDFDLVSYCQLVRPKLKKFVFPFGVDDGQALRYACDGKSIQYRIKLPVVPQPKDKNDWQWFEEWLLLPEKIQKKIKTSLNQQPKRPILLRKTLKGGLEYFFLQFPWEFTKQAKKEERVERALAVDLGLKKIATAVVCEIGKQISKPIYIKLVGGQYQHIERLYKHIAGIQKQQAKLKNENQSEKERKSKEEERKRLYRKRNRLGEELAQTTANLLIKTACDWRCGKIILEDLRSIKPKKGRKKWSRQMNEWLRGRITELLELKSKEKGLRIQKIIPWGTSSHCPRCTTIGMIVLGPNNLTNKKGGRWFYCAHCGFSADRDYIAALNIYRASFINYKTIKSLKDTSLIPYKEMGILRSTVPSGGPEMNHNNDLVVVNGCG